MHTGVLPPDMNYDIDVGIVFDCTREKYADPVELKKKVCKALNTHGRTVVNYQQLAVESLASMKEVPPLTSAPSKMGSTKISSVDGQSLIATKRKQAV